MACEIASTNLVVELGIILALLIGWQFTLAEFTGGPIMIILLTLLFRLFLRQRLLGVAAHPADPVVGDDQPLLVIRAGLGGIVHD